jgi:hypothetical protein
MVIALDKSVPKEQPQKLMTIFACARPVLFADDDRNFPAAHRMALAVQGGKDVVTLRETSP